MTILAVKHVTRYRYRQPVAFGAHRIVLRPRDAHDQRVLASRMEITPKPTSFQWADDVFGNYVGNVRFAGRADELRFENAVWIDHVASDIGAELLEDYARTYPFTYAAEDMPDLLGFFERQSSSEHREIDQWVRTFLNANAPTDTLALLVRLNSAIKRTFTYVTRHEKGVQDPLVTLKLRRGSCRDLAVLLIEAARVLGLAARFVSGYLHVAGESVDDFDRREDGGHMHAWAQVYLPGPGWIDFDPASGTTGNRDLIRVAMVRAPSQAIPIQGTWVGFPSDHIDMRVKVSVVPTDTVPLENPVRTHVKMTG
jgi:transglutaminase-like putative cysteine protease